MLIDGEKWACEACVRGHRVSNCQHSGTTTFERNSLDSCASMADLPTCSDRPLQHINKKGRPVSQCPHCRGLRKSRSTHVRCDCGDKAHTAAQCARLDKGAANSE